MHPPAPEDHELLLHVTTTGGSTASPAQQALEEQHRLNPWPAAIICSSLMLPGFGTEVKACSTDSRARGYYRTAVTLVLQTVRDGGSTGWFAALACLKFTDGVILVQE